MYLKWKKKPKNEEAMKSMRARKTKRERGRTSNESINVIPFSKTVLVFHLKINFL